MAAMCWRSRHLSGQLCTLPGVPSVQAENESRQWKEKSVAVFVTVRCCDAFETVFSFSVPSRSRLRRIFVSGPYLLAASCKSWGVQSDVETCLKNARGAFCEREDDLWRACAGVESFT